MEIYWLLFFWSIITWVLCGGVLPKYNLPSKTIYLTLNYVPLTFFASFRGEYVGADSMGYIGIASRLSEQPIEHAYENGAEMGFVVLSKIIVMMTDDPYYILALVSFLTIVGFGLFFYYNSANIYVSTILFIALGCYTGSLITIRQYLALMIIFWGMNYLWGGKRFKFILCVIIAASIHISMILFLPLITVYPLNRFKICAVLFVMSIVVGGMYSFGSDVLLNLPIADRYMTYFGNLNYGIEKDFGPALLKICLALTVVASVIFIAYEKKVDLMGKQNVLWMILLVLMSCFFVIAGYKMAIIGRFIVTYLSFLTLLIPYVLSICNKNNVAYFYPVMICLSIIYYYRVLMLGHDIGQLEYYMGL